MKTLKKLAGIVAGVMCLAGCTSQESARILVQNPLPVDRNGEMLEIPLRELPDCFLKETFLVRDSAGEEIPYQLTHDSLLIFQASVQAGGKAVYTLTKGQPADVPVTACGRQYPERVDDVAWENDKAAYRAYGPALQARGEKAFGYDVFTKSVSYPVVEQRYARELDTEARTRIDSLRKAGKKIEADSLLRSISYHVDHGNGMDCYSVGPTLGGGTTALMDGDTLLYPYCYKDFCILDNGPLRFAVKLVFHPLVAGADTCVVETRIITLDKGSYLNRTLVSYQGLSAERPLAAGIVVHPQNPEGYVLNQEKHYIAYADSTDNPAVGNGVIYLGAVFGSSMERACVLLLDEVSQKKIGAVGHVLGISKYAPDDVFVYYWGSGWSKGDMPDKHTWTSYLEDYANRLEAPLQVTVE